MLALLLVPVLFQQEPAAKAAAYLETNAEADKNAGHRALAAIALKTGEAAGRIVDALAKAGPKADAYPGDFAMAYTALAVLDAHRRDTSKHADAARAFVAFLRKQQNKEGDWAYSFATGDGRWVETTMNTPLLEALLEARDAKLEVDPEMIKRSAAWIAKQQAKDGRFINDPSRPASTEATLGAVAVLARVDKTGAALKKAAIIRPEDVLAAFKDGKYGGLTDDDRKTWGPESFPYAFTYAALAERRLSGPVTDAKRKAAILEVLGKWQTADGSFDSPRGKVYGTAMVLRGLRALFE